jgi:hypothetical protein
LYQQDAVARLYQRTAEKEESTDIRDRRLLPSRRLAHAFAVSGACMPVRVPVSWLIGVLCCASAASAIVARAAPRNAAVVLDSWWSGDYATKACEQAKAPMDEDTMSRIRNFGCGAVAGCPEAMAHVSACMSGDPKLLASQFGDRLMTQFASSPACKGAAFARYYGPDGKEPSAAEQALMRRPHWELSVDFFPGSAAQSWSLQYLGEEKVFQGESASEARMARDICAIVLGQRSPAR